MSIANGSSIDVSTTFGAVLIGGLFAFSLSGVVAVQALVYFRLYPDDPPRIKALVLLVWMLDLTHSGFICDSIWNYLIMNYGIKTNIYIIPRSVALTIVVTAIVTFIVHCFLAHRIFMLSKRNWYIVCPIIVLAVFRLASATLTTSEMIHLRSLITFKKHFRWVFTLGLALSSSADILITASLFFLLQTSRTESSRMNRVIDLLILYAFETGFLTCAATVTSMICWLAMSNNLIFMGLHFVIGKLYANSFLVTLNTRQKIRRAQSQSSTSDNVLILDPRRNRNRMHVPSHYSPTPPISKAQKLEINVEKSVQYDTDGDLEALGGG